MVRKPFSKDEYDKADVPAKKQMLGWLSHNIPDLITDSRENFGFDIRGQLNGGATNHFYEVEVNIVTRFAPYYKT